MDIAEEGKEGKSEEGRVEEKVKGGKAGGNVGNKNRMTKEGEWV